MNILVICRELPPVGGGAGAVAMQLAIELARRGHRVEAMTMAYGDLPMDETRSGVHIVRVDCGRRHQDSSTIPEMLRFVRRGRPVAQRLAREGQCDIVHAHAIVPDGMIGLQAARAASAALVITAHGSDVPGYNPHQFGLTHRLVQPLWHRVLRASASLITPSRFLAGLIERQRPAQDVKVVPNGISLELFSERKRTEDFLVVSRLVRRKNFHLFLDALRRLDGRRTVHIVGDGLERAALERSAAQISQHEIVFHGWLEHGSPRWRELYETSRFFVLPSERENFPVNLLEAQLAGLIVLASPIEANREVLGEDAVYFPSLSPDEIATTLRTVLAEPPEDLRRSGPARVRAHFAWPEIADRYEVVLRDSRPQEHASCTSA